jgi:hypothetical protein
MRPCDIRNLHLVTYENGMRVQQKRGEGDDRGGQFSA